MFHQEETKDSLMQEMTEQSETPSNQRVDWSSSSILFDCLSHPLFEESQYESSTCRQSSIWSGVKLGQTREQTRIITFISHKNLGI